jgi:hypothetical protein
MRTKTNQKNNPKKEKILQDARETRKVQKADGFNQDETAATTATTEVIEAPSTKIISEPLSHKRTLELDEEATTYELSQSKCLRFTGASK